jgi:hypothetical protein
MVLLALTMKELVFRDVMPCSLTNPEDGGGILLRNIGKPPLDWTTFFKIKLSCLSFLLIYCEHFFNCWSEMLHLKQRH